MAIPIYAAPVTAKFGVNGETVIKTYESFIISHYEGTRRVLRRRNIFEKARSLAREIAGRLSRDGQRAEYLSEKDRRIFTLAQMAAQPSGLDVDKICREYVELQQRLKAGSLAEAVDFYNAYGQRLRCDATAEDVYEEYLQE